MLSGYCFISNTCYKDKATDSTGCKVCDVTKSTSAWTTVPNVCQISGKCYTNGTLDPTKCGKCDTSRSTTSWTIQGNVCLIGGTCYTSGQKGSLTCQVCTPATSKTAWSAAANTCLIDGACYSSGYTAGCFKCDPTTNPYKWTQITGCTTMTLDVGKHSSTYSSSNTRGFWFVAPVKFAIVGLRVPTDVGTEVQNVQVVKFAATPPAYSASTTNHTTLAYHKGVAGSNWIKVNIPIAKGDIIGILGARGTTTMKNSYGSGNPYSTKISNVAVNLTRLIYQANLYSAKAGALSTESGGSYCRIEVQYQP
jgi:hypothetical protein